MVLVGLDLERDRKKKRERESEIATTTDWSEVCRDYVGMTML